VNNGTRVVATVPLLADMDALATAAGSL